MSASIPETMLLSDLLKPTGFDCPADLEGKTFNEATVAKEEIDLDADQFIEALTNAIKAEQSKSGKSFEDAKVEQEKAEAERLKEIAKAEKKNKAEKELNSILAEITDFIKNNKSNMDIIKPILAATKEMGYDNPTKIDNIDDANKILDMIK